MQKVKHKRGLYKILALVLVVTVIFLAARQLGLLAKLEDIKLLQEWFQGLGFVGYAAYLVIYIFAAVFMFPASSITIAAGIVFGPVIGAILSLIGATIGAAVAFIIARYVARDTILNKFGSNPLFEKIDSGFKENGTSFLILTRLVPIFPYNIQNYAYGITPLSLSTFVLVSLITMAPGAAIYAFMAGEIAANGFSMKLMYQLAAAGVILFVVSLIPKYIAKKKNIAL